jgi:hypothetical protein
VVSNATVPLTIVLKGGTFPRIVDASTNPGTNGTSRVIKGASTGIAVSTRASSSVMNCVMQWGGVGGRGGGVTTTSKRSARVVDV